MSASEGNDRSLPGSTLLERTDDLSAIAEACRAARDGDGRVVMISGRAGIGKSSLLMEGQRWARAAGFTVLPARAS